MKSSYTFVAVLRTITRKYSNDVRVRFAPSPTGRLHLGGLRTALYNFLYARANNGTFIIRIEDTDQTRIVQGAAEAIENDLMWVGMKPDESPSCGGSHGPYVQSHRLKHYKDEAERLIEKGAAYRCFCTESRLELLRRDAVRRRAVPRYDNRCRDLSSDEVAERMGEGQPYCVRFKLESGPDEFEDLVYGKIILDTASREGDPVVLKTDGFPTYHLACVVDDHMMEISHVLRGVEWQISTSKHLQLYRAFGWKPPQFGHMPLLMNSNGTKLSKRQGDIDIEHFRKSGIYPEVLLSFVTEFGGGFIRDHKKPTVHNLEDLIRQFDFLSLHTSPCKVDLERLVRLNRLELDRKMTDPDSLKDLCCQLRNLVQQHFGEEVAASDLSDKRLSYLIQWGLPRMSCLEDFCKEDLNYIWKRPQPNLFLDFAKRLPEKFVDVMEIVSCHIINSSEVDTHSLSVAIKDSCQSLDVDYGASMKALRAALSGLKVGPPVAELVTNIGTEEAISRLQLAKEALQKR